MEFDVIDDVVDKLHLFNPKQLRFSTRCSFYPMLYDPVDFTVMETFRAAVDLQHDGSDSRTATLSANAPTADFVNLDFYDPTLILIKESRSYGIESGAVRFGDAVLGGTALRFDFSFPGRYVTDICIHCSDTDETCVRLTKWGKLRGLAGKGYTHFSQCYSPCRDRLTFLFDMQGRLQLLFELNTAERHGALNWAKITRL